MSNDQTEDLSEGSSKSKIDLRRVLVDLWRRIWMLAIVVGLASVAGYFGGKKLSKQTYETQTSLVYRPNDEKKGDGDPQKNLNTLKEIVKVRTNLELIREKLRLKKDIDQIGKALEVEVEKNTNLLVITATWDTAEGAADVANACRDTFLASQISLDQTQASRQREAQARRRAQVISELATADKELQDFARKYEITDFVTMARAFLEGFNSSDLAYQQSVVEYQTNTKQVENLDKIVQAQKAKVAQDQNKMAGSDTMTNLSTKMERLRTAIHDDQELRARQADLSLRQIDLDRMKKLYADGAVPKRRLDEAQSAYDKQKALTLDTEQVKVWRKELTKLQDTVLPSDSVTPAAQLLQSMLAKDFELQLEKVAVESKVKSLKTARDDYADKLQKLPDIQRTYAILTRKVESLEAEKKTLDDNVAKADRLLDITAPDFLTVTKAKVPPLPKTSNHKQMTIMSFVMVFFLGLMGIVGTIILDPRLKSKGDLSGASKFPVLGELNIISRKNAEFPPAANSELAVTLSALTRSIRRQIPRQGARIALAGIRTGDGGTSMASGIASSLARQGERVLLISLSTGENATTLTYPELEPVNWVVLANSEAPDLGALAHGGQPGRPYCLPPLPTSVSADDLTSLNMRSALQNAESSFDVVIFDLEAVREGMQVELMGGFCDGVILVAKSAVMKRDVVKRVERDLEAAKVPLKGWILNFVPRMYQEPL